MKHFIWILVFGCALAQGVPAQKAPQKAAAQKKAEPAAVSVPAGAEKLEDGLWRARDAQGKTWLYKKTPFGIVRTPEEKPQPAQPPEASSCRVVKADSVEAVFEKNTPFGRRTWTRRLAELDEEERRALEEWKKAKP